MKLLISAYSCEPGMGSEPGVGWNIVREVAKYHEVWVLTRPDESKDVIEAELARNPIPQLHFVYFTLPFWRDSRKWGQSGGMQLHYYLWQIQAYFVARQLHRQIGFDLVHHVTFVKYSSPSFLAFLPAPFVWGPLGGGESAPRAFWQDFSFKAKIYEVVRSFVRRLGEQDPFVRYTAKKSSAIRATTQDTADRLLKIGATKVKILSQLGLSEAEIAKLAQYKHPDNQTIRFISIGRLLHWKGFHLGLRAFAMANLPHAEYWIVGEGSELERLQSLAQELNLSDKVKFWGSLSRSKTLSLLESCHVLLHPSLHDSGGMVCMEAMAAGRPVICLDLGGPAIQVTEQTGFKVKAETPQQAIRDLAEAMTQLVKDGELRNKMGQAGKEQVSQNYNWKIIGEHFNQLYLEIGNNPD
jgi:glycosyltransferase involved in cell wall biosynthesis